MAIEDQLLAVGREAARESPIDRQSFLGTTADRYLVQRRDTGKGAVAMGGAEYHVLRIPRPPDHVVGSGVVGEAARRASRRGDDEDIRIAVTIRRKGDPGAVGR